MKVVIVPVGKEPYIAEVSNSLQAMQKLVDGYIEVIPIGNGLCLVCDEEGKINGKEGNRRIYADLIAGDFFVVAEGTAGDFAGLSDEQAAAVVKRFLIPEYHTKKEVEDGIVIMYVPCN